MSTAARGSDDEIPQSKLVCSEDSQAQCRAQLQNRLRALPFRGESSGVIFETILNKEPVSPVRLNPDLPPKLEDIINRALEKDKNLRYQHAADMHAELQRLKRDTEARPSRRGQ